MAKANRQVARKRRHVRVRRKVVGTLERPRLNVYRSLHHIYAQVIDDSSRTNAGFGLDIGPATARRDR